MQKFEQRVMEVLAEESQGLEAVWYLSFAGVKFNGAVILKAHGLGHATMQSHALGINHGGQVMGVPDPGR